jgi:hypothetical protein
MFISFLLAYGQRRDVVDYLEALKVARLQAVMVESGVWLAASLGNSNLEPDTSSQSSVVVEVFVPERPFKKSKTA